VSAGGLDYVALILVTIGRVWSRIIRRCWQNRTPHDAALHTGLQQHNQDHYPAGPTGRDTHQNITRSGHYLTQDVFRVSDGERHEIATATN
jgi:hypothetical protein